jgi:hypothetical protein
MPMTSDSVWYVYGIVPGDASPIDGRASMSGIDDADVVMEREGNIGALVSVLDATRYGPAALESNTADVEWLGPRAVAHDRVLTWASEHGPVVPLPMFSVFSGRAAVREVLGARREQFAAALDRARAGREFALRVYRVDTELLPEVSAFSERVRELEAQAAAATPGQRYLRERKLEGERKAELQNVGQHIVTSLVERLAADAVGVVQSPIPRITASEAATTGTMVLNAAFLVAQASMPAFQRTLTEFVDRHSGRGFRFDFTGPWPPYHFVGGELDDR